MKTCTKCRVDLPFDEFPRDKSRRDGRFPWCNTCNRKNVKDWTARNQEHAWAASRERGKRATADGRGHKYQLKSRYGLTVEEHEALKADQKGCCAICGRERPLHIDHDHGDNRVRALLCGPCNRGIGLFEDNSELATAAAEYLRKHGR